MAKKALSSQNQSSTTPLRQTPSLSAETVSPRAQPAADVVTASPPKASTPPSITAPFVCPFCLLPEIINPVILHSSSGASCLSCPACAVDWNALLECTHEQNPKCPICSVNVSPSASPSFSVWSSLDATPPRNLSLRAPASPAETAALQCGICEEALGTLECVECKFPLCATCHAESHSKGRFKTHQVVAVGTAKSVAPRTCPLHPTNALELFCENCQECICVHCCFSTVTHSGHKATPLTSLVQQVRNQTSESLSALAKQCQLATSLKQKLEAAHPQITEKRESILANMNAFFEQLRCAINNREQALCKEVDDSLRQTSDAMQQHTVLLEKTDRQADALIQSLEQMFAEAHPVDIVTMQSSIAERTRQLFLQLSAVDQGDTCVQSLLAPLSTVRFTPSVGHPHFSTVEQLAHVLQAVGTVGLPTQPLLAGSPGVPKSGRSRSGPLLDKNSPHTGTVPAIVTTFSPGSAPQQQAQQVHVPYAKAVPPPPPQRSKLVLPSLAIAAEMLPADDGESLPNPPPVSSRKRFLSISNEDDEPPRAKPGLRMPSPPSAGGSSSAQPTATMGQLSNLFFPKTTKAATATRRPGDGEKTGQGPAPASGLHLRL